MKIALRRTELIAALEKVSKVSPTSKTVPILTYVKVEAADGKVSFSATDLMSSLVVSADAVVKEAGSSLLPVHDFLIAMRSTNANGVALVLQDDGLLSKAGPTTWLWKTLALDSFPAIVDWESAVIHTIPRADLLKALRLTKWAASRNSYQVALEQIGIRNGHVLAADGIRYHSVEVPNTNILDVAIPLGFADELIALLGNSDAPNVDLGVTADQRALVVRHGDSTLSTLVRQEPFPDVTSAFLVPVLSHHYSLKVSRETLEGAVRRVRVLSNPDTSAVRLILSGSKFNTMDVSSQSNSGAWSTERLVAEWDGPDRILTFHHEHLTRLLSMFEGETLTLRLGDDAKHKPSPLLIIEEGRSGVLQQLRVDWQT